MRKTFGIRTCQILAIAGLTLGAAACSSYPTEPRYATRADPNAWTAPQPAYPPVAGQPGQPVAPVEEAPPPRTAPIDSIEGGALPSAGGNLPRPTTSQDQSGPAVVASPAILPAGATAYVVQSGDTLSGVARRFRTPVRTLIELNALGADGGVRAGQRVILPAGAVDIGSDPYATGPAPTALPAGTPAPTPRPAVPTAAPTATPPPAMPPRATPGPVAPAPVVPAPVVPAPRPTPVVPAPRPAPSTPAPVAPAPAAPGALSFQWPVRGEIVRRFGPVGLGERNNGVNIGASAGTAVVAAAPGRVAYVGDALPGQGLTVLIMHRDGWRTVYGHLATATVDDGDDVRAGQQIGTVGTSAGDGRPSMHFETRRMQGDNPQAVDPLTVLPR